MTQKITNTLHKAKSSFKTFQCEIHVPQLNFEHKVSSTTLNQSFHSASVGKLFTSVLIMKAIDDQKISLDTLIESLLPEELLNHLFVYKDNDYRSEVTIKHLLNHTSGVNDYFESKTIDGSSFIQTVLDFPQTYYTPQSLIQFTQTKQKAVGKPNDKFHYSDTGYILLGLCLEKIYEKTFADIIQDEICIPLKLNDTYLCFYDERFKDHKLAPIWVNKVEVSNFTSLSCDFSGGGLHTTTHDLTLFLNALLDESLISQDSLNQMTQFNYKFRPGIHYGLGMMQLHFEEFFFLFKGLPRMIGHLGVTGVHAWIDPQTKTSIVMNVGNMGHMAKSFQTLITVVQLINQELKKQK
jgi:D-alanyl-D-alanine carboxypeptidase